MKIQSKTVLCQALGKFMYNWPHLDIFIVTLCIIIIFAVHNSKQIILSLSACCDLNRKLPLTNLPKNLKWFFSFKELSGLLQGVSLWPSLFHLYKAILVVKYEYLILGSIYPTWNFFHLNVLGRKYIFPNDCYGGIIDRGKFGRVPLCGLKNFFIVSIWSISQMLILSPWCKLGFFWQ